MMIKKTIKLINKEALSVGKASLSIFTSKEGCTIAVSINREELNFVSSDYFNSLNLFRDYLFIKKEVFPNLKGALISVYPSRMSRQMSDGLMAYNHINGKQADDVDLVNIFDKVDENEYLKLSSVHDQLNNYKKWLKSL